MAENLQPTNHGLRSPISGLLRAPELLAPAGDAACLRAAIENGADAIYFGLESHNARARATNFTVDALPELMGELHRRGVRGYVALNTLVFSRELDRLESVIRSVASAGADAVIVQDIGLCRLIRAITPDLEIHASTQMTVTSAAGVRMASELGCSRVILARELSLEEIAQIRAEVDMPLEVFVHGALCVAYSGQCLTSEALGGRSANRGECAQACRLPYEIICDGRSVDLERIEYLLSPQDLAAYDLIPRLVELGIAGLKIEGRLKSPEYVANITNHYRHAIDAACTGRPVEWTAAEIREMQLSFSRGFSHGFLDGPNHKALVRGDYSKKRGVPAGRVFDIRAGRVHVELEIPLSAGDGLVFDGDTRSGVTEQGGRVYRIEPVGPSTFALEFGHGDLDVQGLAPGQKFWKTDDPALTRRLRASFAGGPKRLVPLALEVHAETGKPLRIQGRVGGRKSVEVVSEAPLEPATKLPATEALLREQLGRLGGTVFRLESLAAHIMGAPMAPKRVLNDLRRRLVNALDHELASLGTRSIASDPVLPGLRRGINRIAPHPSIGDQVLVLAVLVRTLEQGLAALDTQPRTIYLDFQHPSRYRQAIEAIRTAARGVPLEIVLATPRIEKAGEESLTRHLTRQGADALLVRNAGGVEWCRAEGVPFVADYSLNAANELTTAWLLEQGARRVTASYDLSIAELGELQKAAPAGSLEIVVHQHMPMFHMEHCVFCAFLSPGTDKTNCGRPCDQHDVKLRDRVGMEHSLTADIGCRNTLFHAVPQSAAEFIPALVGRGARSLRIEFVNESATEVTRVLELYQNVLRAKEHPKVLWKALKAENRYGVTRGQLVVL